VNVIAMGLSPAAGPLGSPNGNHWAWGRASGSPATIARAIERMWSSLLGSFDAVAGCQPDHRVFERDDQFPHADAAPPEVDHRINDQLTGPVIGHLPAAIDSDHRDVAGREQLTHAAGWHASAFVRTVLFRARTRADATPLALSSGAADNAGSRLGGAAP
jgi:hypothetical protein